MSKQTHTSEYQEFNKMPEVKQIQEPAARYLGGMALEDFTRAQQSETHPLATLETNMRQAITGQSEAVDAIVRALSREKFRNPNRPIANMLFLGPTGVGKSETAKELVRQLHGDDEAFIKIDCSSFSHGHEITSLVGAPPSYVGFGQPPIFNPDIVERERSVILFDEIEKGSQELWDLMLQIMDDGELMLSSAHHRPDKDSSSANSRKVSFKNSIIILTSNLGSNEMSKLLNPSSLGFQSSKLTRPEVSSAQIDQAAIAALQEYFRPEFINRIDTKVVFKPLSDEELGSVLTHYVEGANQHYEKAGIAFELSPALRDKLVSSNSERSQYGARPILRDYDRLIESRLATMVSTGSIPPGNRVIGVTPEEVGEEGDEVLFYFDEDFDLFTKHVPKRAIIPSWPEYSSGKTLDVWRAPEANFM